MKKVAVGGLALFTFVACVVACSNFSGDEPPGTAPTGDGSADGGDGGGVPRDGFVLAPFPAEPAFVIQGKRLKLPVKIQRGANFQEPVAIVIPTPPKGIAQLGNAIITGDTIDVEIEVDASFKQGVVELLLEARSERTVTQSAKPKLFVRGPSGALDKTFGSEGVLDTGFDANMQHVQDAVVLPDHRIVLVSTCLKSDKSEYVSCTVRLSENGATDTSYGKNGLAVSEHKWAYLGALSGGKLVIVSGGVTFDSLPVTALRLARLEANGDPDPTFGDPATPGIRDYPNFPYYYGVGGIYVDASNRLVVPVATWDLQTVRLQVLRTLPNGLPDPAFGSNGFATHPELVDHGPHGLLFVGDKMVVSGRSKSGNAIVARLGTDGILDATYGASAGVTTFSTGYAEPTYGFPAGVVGTNDGAMLVPHALARTDVRIAKVAADGKALVEAYGAQGVAQYGGRINAQLLATSDNKLLALTTGSGPIARLDASGKLDTTFASNGSLDLSGAFTARMTAFGPERVIVVGGKSASEKKPVVRRFWL